MNWREQHLRFSIRKFKVAVASTVIGMHGVSTAAPVIYLAQPMEVTAAEVMRSPSSPYYAYSTSYYNNHYASWGYNPYGVNLSSNSLNSYRPTTNRVTERLEAIPYSAEYREDANLAHGQYRILRAGREGQKRVRYNNGVAISEVIVRQPVHQIIAWGTKVAQPVVTERVEALPFATEYRDDATLAQGSERLLQEGVAGQKRLTFADGKLTGETVLVAPVNRVVLRGTKVAPLATSEQVAISYETEVMADDSLPLGQEVLVRAGQSGLRENRYLDGQLVASQVLQAPVSEVIKRGTKVAEILVEQPVSQPVVETPSEPGETPATPEAGQVTEEPGGQPTAEPIVTPVVEAPTESVLVPVQPQVVETYGQETVAFETDIIEDADLPLGQELVVQEGREGLRDLVYRDGQLVSSLISQEPVNRQIRRGTKPIEGEVTERRLVEVAFETAVVYDDHQYTDYRQETGGVVGQTELVETYRTINGQKTDLILSTSERQVTAPVDKVITIGTKPIDGAVTIQTSETLPFETERQVDPNIWVDSPLEILQAGREGQHEIATIYKTIRGQQTSEVISKTVTLVLSPEKQIERVGSKPLEGTETEVTLVVIPAPVKEVFDPKEYTDYTHTKPGQAGEKEVTKVYETLRGLRVGQPQVTERVVTAATATVITKGTKPIEGSLTETRLVALPFTIQTQEDANLWADTPRQVVVAGQEGSKQLTTTYKTVKGQKTDQVLSHREEVLADPRHQVEKIGTKPVHGTVTEIENKVLPVTTRYEDDPKALLGSQTVKTPGQAGLVKVTKVYQTVRGVKEGQPQVTEETVTPMQEKVVVRGTKVPQEADKQTPKAIKQVAYQGQVPSAAASIDQAKLTNVVSYAWQVQPDTRQARQGLTAQVLVTYTDQSVDRVPVTLDVLALKAAPSLTLTAAQVDDNERTVTVSYELTDSAQTYLGARLDLYQGTKKVSETLLTPADLAGKTLALPGVSGQFHLKTQLFYNPGTGEVSKDLPARAITLDYKKLEIKDIDQLTLIQQQDGQFVTKTSLDSQPSDVSQYLVRVTSDRFKDLLLPVGSIREEALSGGGTAYRVTTKLPELVEDTDASSKSTYKSNFSFLVQKANLDEQVYTNFKALVDAMVANPSGSYTLGADLFADDLALATNQVAYVTTTFRGQLTGQHQGQQFAIYNLAAPLFSRLESATISHLDLKKVDIKANNLVEVGALAPRVSTSTVRDVSVQGQLTASRHLGGLTYMNDRSLFDNTSFTGSLTALGQGNDSNVGGIAGAMSRGTIQNSRADVTIQVQGRTANYRTGGIVGFADGASAVGQDNLHNVYATGQVTNSGTAGVTGGIIGATRSANSSQAARLRQVLSAVQVTNGKLIYGYETGIAADRMVNLYAVQGQASGGSQSLVQTQTSQEASKTLAAMPITTRLTDSGHITESTRLATDYTSLARATADRRLAYDNIEKLMPFYNKELIVKYGNLVDQADKLYTTALLSVTPMVDNQVISDVYSNKAALNKLMLHFADGSVTYKDIAYAADFRQTGISEYRILGTDLIYTPEQFLSNYDKILSRVLPELAAVTYKSEAMRTALAVPGDAAGLDKAMDQLYLEESFQAVQDNLADNLRQVLATDKAINTTGGVVDDYLVNYITANKESLLMGLAYMTRWYNINFGTTNIKNLATFHQDFFGQPVNTLEWLVGLADKGYNNLLASNNLTTFAAKMAPQTGQTDLLGYLTKNRQLFTDYQTDNDWFKASTKAYVVETKSDELPSHDVSVYKALSKGAERNGILPLLSAEEGIFVLSNTAGLTYGMYDRYYDTGNLRNLTREEQVEQIKLMAQQASEWQAEHMDFWYRMTDEATRGKVFKEQTTWDGYIVGGKRLPKEGAEANRAIKDFFGPVGTRSNIIPMVAGAYANGTNIFFLHDRVLDQYGTSVFTHEAAHNNDGKLYLNGQGRRPGQGAELYAQGLLQAPSSVSNTAFGINSVYDYEALGHKEATNRYHNLTPDRFKSNQDLQDYFKGVFDVLYTLDYAEADVVLNLSKEQQKLYYNKIENHYIQDSVSKQDTHAGNRIRKFTDEEWAKMDLRTVYDLIDNDVISTRTYALNKEDGSQKDHGRNGYYYADMFSPIYSALDNKNGSPGDIMFRRMAFELLAAKGYEEGFVPYTSGQLAQEAIKRGSTATETWPRPHTVGRVTDDLVFEHVLADQHDSWKDFKKDMYKQRIDRVADLKPVTITYNNRDVTLSSIEQIKALLAEANREDQRRFLTITEKTNINNNNRSYANNSRVKEVKAKIYNAYLRLTEDFTSSIYK